MNNPNTKNLVEAVALALANLRRSKHNLPPMDIYEFRINAGDFIVISEEAKQAISIIQNWGMGAESEMLILGESSMHEFKNPFRKRAVANKQPTPPDALHIESIRYHYNQGWNDAKTEQSDALREALEYAAGMSEVEKIVAWKEHLTKYKSNISHYEFCVIVNIAVDAIAKQPRDVLRVKPETLPIDIDETLAALHKQYQFCSDAIIPRNSKDAKDKRGRE